MGGYDAVGGSGNGKSLYAVGDSLYLGRTVGGTEFLILNNSNPATADPPGLVALGGKPDVDESVNGLVVRDYLSFLLTNSQLRVLKTNVPASISPYASVALPAGSQGRSLDCEGNFLYAGFTLSGKAYVGAITGP